MAAAQNDPPNGDQPKKELSIGVALDRAGWHPAAWRDSSITPKSLTTAAYWSELAATAERGLLDFLTIEDSLAAPGDPTDGSPSTRKDLDPTRIDANLIAATLAPLTRTIGLIPTVTATHTEPFHVSTAIATLDHTSLGRAGWQVKVSAGATEANNFGRRDIPALDLLAGLASDTLPDFVIDLFEEAADAVEVVRRLWDSWEDDAEIRDVATRRFIDRDKLHYVDFAGKYFSVRGPSITPRSPQGQPVVAALAHRDIAYQLAARAADLVFTTPPADGGERVLADLAAATSTVDRHGEGLRTYADAVVFLDAEGVSGTDRLHRLNDLSGHEFSSDAAILTGAAAEIADQVQAWNELGFSGIRLRPGVTPTDLAAITDDLIPELARRGRFRTQYPEGPGSLRALLGLPTDIPNRYSATTPAA